MGLARFLLLVGFVVKFWWLILLVPAAIAAGVGDFGQRGLTSSLRLPHGDVRSRAWRVARCVVLGEFGSTSPSGGTRGSRDGLAD
jgi:hypothetical protein